MKIIQTFWTAPIRKNKTDDPFGRNAGGWNSEKYLSMSWALSCLKFRQFYPQVELFTDNEGEDWLINKLRLPFTHVDKSLNTFNDYPSDLWALAKLKTYALQNTPFLHADGDVYIWKAFNPDFIRNELFTQNIEYE